MRLSVNIAVDALQPFAPKVGRGVYRTKAFRKVSALRNETPFEDDCLYVGLLSERRASERITGCCVLIRNCDVSDNEIEAGSDIVVSRDASIPELIDTLRDLYILISEWYENMLLTAASQGSVQDILTLSESIIGNFISASDSALALIAYTKGIDIDDPVSNYLIEYGHHSEDSYKMFLQANRYDIWMRTDGLVVNTDRAIARYSVVSKIFKFDKTYFMHVVMSCNNRPLTPGLEELFKIMCEVLEHLIRRNWDNDRFFSHSYQSLIIDLINGGGKANRTAVESRARIIGIDPDQEYIIILLEIGSGEGKAFPGRIAQDIFSLFARIRAVHYDSRLLLLLHSRSIAQYAESVDLPNKLNEYLAENNLRGGVSDVFADLTDLPDAYLQAKLALFHGLTDKSVTHYEDIFAKSLLDFSQNTMLLWSKSRYGKLLLELRRSDLEKNQNNIKLLRSYMLNERRAKETADEMHMHRNNVVYRIKRIEEMNNLSFDDPKTRVNVLLSFLMFDHWQNEPECD